MAQISRKDIKRSDFNDWMAIVDEWLVKNWGINRTFALKLSLFLLYNSIFNNAWTITSGFRDPRKQAEMQKAWDAGNRTGLVVRPATNSKHSKTAFLNSPNAMAIDIRFQDQEYAGKISRFFGIKWGGNFRNKDLVHFYI